MRIASLGIVLAGLMVATPSVPASVMVLGASKDTTLYEDAASGLGGGQSGTFFLGRLGTLGNGLLRRGAIAFDLSAIPNGAVVTNASLNLTLFKGNGGAQAIDLHRFTKNWGEGASPGGPQGSLAATNDATWKFNFFNTSSWSNPGGDFSPTISATQLADFSGSVTWGSTAGMVADVQGWVNNSASNFGWILIGNESTLQTAKEFASRESFSGQPALTVTFTVPEPATCAVVATLGAAMFLTRRRLAGAR